LSTSSVTRARRRSSSSIVAHLPDRDARHRHGRARLQAADLIERGVQLEAAASRIAHAADLDRQIGDGAEADGHEQADDQVADR
jgi:hypothetical protein